jgi:hypothetical protein
MFLVTINKSGNQNYANQTLPTLEEAQQWLESGSRGEWWGKPAWTEIIPAVTEMQEVVITPAELDAEGNVITEAVTEMQEVVITPEQVIEHPAEFTYTIEDISAQVAFEKSIATNIARMEFGKRLMAELAASNQADLIAGSLTVQQVIEAEAALATIQRLILNGSLGLAVGALQQTTIPHMSQAKKDAFLAKMTAYLGAE